jgi:hypothetical protein
MHGVAFALSIIPGVPWGDFWGSPLFLYFSPETILPVASILAGIIGVVLMFGRYFLSMIRKTFKRTSAMANQETAEIEDIDLSVDRETGPRSKEVSG